MKLHPQARSAPARRAVALAALLASTAALGDARVEARRHFRSGMALLKQRRFEEGITALQEAYRIKPHPHVLYNIARAQQSAGQLGAAVETYRRYLQFDPSDAAEVQRLIAQLEPRLSRRRPLPAPEPESPEPEKPEPPRPELAVDPKALERLDALARRLESAVERAERAAEQPAGEAALPPEAPAAASEGGEESEVPYEETVVTASRRAQSTLEAPNATTVITAEEIRLSGATSLPELLRRVPGAEVMVMGVGSSNVSLRGFNQRLANKLLLLVDGRPEYQDFLGVTLWPTVTVGLEEIERIEVIRGPGSALYGANAFVGVVNVITRKPGVGPKGEFTAAAGTGNQVQGSFVAAGGERGLRYRASVGYAQADKWTRDFSDDRPDVGPRTANPDLGLQGARGNLTTSYAFSRDVVVTTAGGVSRLFAELYPPGLLRNFYVDGLTGYATAALQAGPVRVRTFWNHLSANAGPQYMAVGLRSLESKIESNVFDGEVTFGKELELLGTHRLDLGVAGRLKRVSWSFIGGLKEELHAAAFLQDEWRIADPFRIQVSYRVDRHPLLDEGRPGYAQSPRVSALWMPAEGHALRASYATAFREPTFLESYTEVRVPMPGVNGASALTTGSLSLKPEQLTAYELGYRGEDAEAGLDWDLSAYQHDVRELVGLSAAERLPADQAYDELTGTYLVGRSRFFNEPAAYTARGVEGGLKLTPVDGLDLKVSAALQRVASSGEGTCGPCAQAPTLKAYGGLTWRSSMGLDFGAEAQFVTATTWVEREPSATDPTQISFVEYHLPEYLVLNARVGYRMLEDRVTVGLTGSQLGPSHAEHPFGNLIQRRFLATLSVTP